MFNDMFIYVSRQRFGERRARKQDLSSEDLPVGRAARGLWQRHGGRALQGRPPPERGETDDESDPAWRQGVSL